MARRLFPLLPIFVAALCNYFGAPGLAFVMLFAAVPFAGAALLKAVADFVDGKADRSRTGFTAGALALIVVAAATRSTALVSLCLAVYCLDTLLALGGEIRTEASSRRAARA